MSVVLPALGVLVLLAVSAGMIRIAITDCASGVTEHGDSDDNGPDGDGGGGGGLGGGGLDPHSPAPDGADPDWWPAFERQFADYVASVPVG